MIIHKCATHNSPHAIAVPAPISHGTPPQHPWDLSFLFLFSPDLGCIHGNAKPLSFRWHSFDLPCDEKNKLHICI